MPGPTPNEIKLQQKSRVPESLDDLGIGREGLWNDSLAGLAAARASRDAALACGKR